ncbi:MAG: helix-turn-helix transcriptional regulator [Cyanobacteria bacterium P01_H01_bin.105]
MVQQTRIEHIRDWNIPGSSEDPRLLHCDPSDIVFIHPKDICQGYSQEIWLQDDICLVIIDRTLTRSVMIDRHTSGTSIEFEFELTGSQAGYSYFFPHLDTRNLAFLSASKRTFKVEVFFKLPALTNYFQAFIDRLTPQKKPIVERFLQIIYRYYYGCGTGRTTTATINQLFDPAIKPYSYLTFEQILSNALYSELRALGYELSCPITPAMGSVIEQILSCPYSGATRRTYLKQKALELVNLYLDAMLELRLEDDDLSCVYQAEAILRENMVNPPTLENLAKQVGTNRRKLNEGFRTVYKTTPFGYLRNCRLNQANWLLMTSELSIGEVGAAVGYTSRSRFASAFRQRSGVNPKAFQLQAWQYAS